MKCPVCGDEIVNDRCNKCGKNIVDVCFKLAETYQAQRDYEKAQKIMEELRKNITDAAVLNDIERIIKGIEFTRADSRDKGYIEESKVKEPKLNPIIIILLIILGLVGGLTAAYFISDGKAYEKVTNLIGKKKPDVTSEPAIEIKNIFLADVENQFSNYQEGIFEKDIDGNGINELVIVNKNNYYAFLPASGGRLVYWCDLKNQIEFAGGGITKNTSTTYSAIFNNNNVTLTETLYPKDADPIKMSEVVFAYKQESQDILLFNFEQYTKKIVFNENGFDVEYLYPKEINSITVHSLLQPDFFAASITTGSGVYMEEAVGKLSLVNKNSKYELEIEYYNGCTSKKYEDMDVGKKIDLNFEISNPKITFRKIERLE